MHNRFPYNILNVTFPNPRQQQIVTCKFSNNLPTNVCTSICTLRNTLRAFSKSNLKPHKRGVKIRRQALRYYQRTQLLEDSNRVFFLRLVPRLHFFFLQSFRLDEKVRKSKVTAKK